MHQTTEDAPPRTLYPVAPDQPVCLVLCGSHGLRSASLLRDHDLVVGRHTSCQLSLPEPTLSRFHARFARRGSQVLVEDMGSRHGTWVAGQRVERAELEIGGALRLADVVVTIAAASSADSSSIHASSPSEATDAARGPRMQEVYRLLQRAARVTAPVHIIGETGTGKELAAQELHRASGRKGALRTLNCAAIPPQLIESTLFGHERGAFSGADRMRPSIFEEASGGTLFLDEVGELSLPAQAALLRVLETQRVTRVGSNREITVDVRVVSATHRNLGWMVERGEFRADTFHRLCVISLEIPPLRARPEEIPALVHHFLKQAEGARVIDPRALSRLEQYAWPGNIRELRNVIVRAAALAQSGCVEERDLPESLRASTSRQVSFLADEHAQPVAFRPGQGLRGHLRSIEHSHIQRALDEAGGNQRKASALLGVPLRTFERRLRALRLQTTPHCAED